MSTQTKVSHLCAVAIIYRAANPGHLLLEMKDGGLPMKAFRWTLNLIGGNWIGEGGKDDQNPLETVRRELLEELTFDRKPVTSEELEALGLEGHETYVTPRNDRTVTSEDERGLNLVREAIIHGLTPFGDFMTTTPKSYLDRADPENTRAGWSAVCSYFTSALGEVAWRELVRLQGLFGNLSSESLSVVTTVQQIIKDNQKVAWGHDRALREFLIGMGVPNAREFPLVRELGGDYLGQTMASYEDYLRHYEIARYPQK